MSHVQRRGGPTLVHLRIVRTFVVPLDTTPSREWEVLFRQPVEFTSVFHPNRIRIERGGLVFDSEEHQVEEWLRYLDRWIASANKRLADRRSGRASGAAGAPAWEAAAALQAPRG